MRSQEFITELRARPDLNTKIKPDQAIKDAWVQTSDTIPGTDWKNLFISFTSIIKLGVNPSTKYNTPIGIYAYPADYVVRRLENGWSMAHVVPFAADQPYFTLFKSKGNVMLIDKISEQELEPYYKTLKHIISKYEPDEDIVGTARAEGPMRARVANKPGGIFWYVTMKCAQVLAGAKGSSMQSAWNWLFRMLGIECIVDHGYHGVGIIHGNEPSQALFLSTESIQVIDTMRTGYRHHSMLKQKKVDIFRNPNPDVKQAIKDRYKILYDRVSNNKASLPHIPQRERIQMLRIFPSAIKFYHEAGVNPSDLELANAHMNAVEQEMWNLVNWMAETYKDRNFVDPKSATRWLT